MRLPCCALGFGNGGWRRSSSCQLPRTGARNLEEVGDKSRKVPNRSMVLQGGELVASTSKRSPLTLDALDLLRAEAGEGPLVLGASDAGRAYSSLDIHNWDSNGRPPLPRGHSFSRHLRSVQVEPIFNTRNLMSMSFEQDTRTRGESIFHWTELIGGMRRAMPCSKIS